MSEKESNDVGIGELDVAAVSGRDVVVEEGIVLMAPGAVDANRTPAPFLIMLEVVFEDDRRALLKVDGQILARRGLVRV